MGDLKMLTENELKQTTDSSIDESYENNNDEDQVRKRQTDVDFTNQILGKKAIILCYFFIAFFFAINKKVKLTSCIEKSRVEKSMTLTSRWTLKMIWKQIQKQQQQQLQNQTVTVIITRRQPE